MAEPRVSVIVPAYKCAHLIGRAINTIMAQTRPADEIIVVDDGSPDDIPAALRPYGDRITYRRKSNGGAASARNVGIDMATGDLIAFLDSDDLWFPNKLATQLAVFQEYPEVGLVSSRYRIDENDGSVLYCPDLDKPVWDRVVAPTGAEAFQLAMYVWTSVVMVRRSHLGSRRFDTGLRIAEDRDLWVKLVTQSPIYLQSECQGSLVELMGSLSRSDIDLDCECMLKMIHHHKDLLGPAGVRHWEALVYRRWAGTYLSQGRFGRALRLAARRLAYEPLSPEGWWVLAKSSVSALAGFVGAIQLTDMVN